MIAIRGLTLWQPWASLIMVGAKRIETRCWATNYRGLLAIHAAKQYRMQCRDLEAQEPFYSALRPDGNYCYPWTRCGQILCIARLIDCVQIESKTTWPAGFKDDLCIPPLPPELAFGDYRPGRFAWILKDVRPLAESISCSGGQKLWRLPEEIAFGIDRALAAEEAA